jgi:hypothetical protein
MIWSIQASTSAEAQFMLAMVTVPQSAALAGAVPARDTPAASPAAMIVDARSLLMWSLLPLWLVTSSSRWPRLAAAVE